MYAFIALSPALILSKYYPSPKSEYIFHIFFYSLILNFNIFK